MKTKTKNKKSAVLYIAGLVSLAIICFIFAPRSSDMLVGEPQIPMLNGKYCEPIAKIDPANVSVMLDNELFGKYAYICCADTRSVIAEKDSGTKASPASLTKIMTAIVILENADNLDAKVTVSEKIYGKLYSEGASMAGFLPGETVTLRDLLYGIMLPSGAEAAAAAAEYIAGSDSALVDMMNSKAAEMGLSNTHFENIYGFDDDSHYSNAAEMASILMYALENDTFREITQTRSYTVKPTNKHSDGFTMNSTVFTKIGDNIPKETVILGGKTGYTYDAGLCLATYAEHDGKTYVAVVMGADGNHRTEHKLVYDTVYLFDYFT